MVIEVEVIWNPTNCVVLKVYILFLLNQNYVAYKLEDFVFRRVLKNILHYNVSAFSSFVSMCRGLKPWLMSWRRWLCVSFYIWRSRGTDSRQLLRKVSQPVSVAVTIGYNWRVSYSIVPLTRPLHNASYSCHCPLGRLLCTGPLEKYARSKTKSRSTSKHHMSQA